MAAPKGNKFWQRRSKHGRNKLFATPELLYEAACEYFMWCDRNPWRKNEAIKSGDNAGKLIKVPTQRPYTLSGLCLYLGVNQGYFYDFKKTCGKDFSDIVTRIEEIIETQQFEGAIVGAFNPNIIARKLGLSEKTESQANVSIRSEFDDYTNEELEAFIYEGIKEIEENEKRRKQDKNI